MLQLGFAVGFACLTGSSGALQRRAPLLRGGVSLDVAAHVPRSGPAAFAGALLPPRESLASELSELWKGGRTPPLRRVGKKKDLQRLTSTRLPMWVKVVGWVLFLLVFIYVFGRVTLLFWNLRKEMMRVRTGFANPESLTFRAYLRYRFGYWFVWTNGANAILIGMITLMMFLFGAILYSTFSTTNMFSSMWKIFVWLVAPDAGDGEKRHVGAFIGAIMSIVGLVVFAMLLTLLQDSFAAYINGISEGREPVMESGHTLLLGITDHTFPVIQELCKANESTGGGVIVILTSNLTKLKMEAKIMEMDVDPLGSRLVVREGMPHRASDLKHVAADTAKSVVIMPDTSESKEIRDTFVLRALIALRGKDWPVKGRILVVCTLPRNKQLFLNMGGPNTDVVTLDIFCAKLMVKCSQQAGLGGVVKAICGFDDAEFYIRPVPAHLQGKTFSAARLYFSSGVLCGVARQDATAADPKEHSNLCPDNDYHLKATDDLVILADDSASADASEEASLSVDLGHDVCPALTPMTSRSERQSIPETVIIFGWNDLTGLVILELDVVLPYGSEVVVVAPTPAENRNQALALAQKRFERELQNVTKITHVEGNLAARYLIDELPGGLFRATRIFVVADQGAREIDCPHHFGAPSQADSCTIGVYMQLRDAFQRASGGSDGSYEHRVSIVLEIQDKWGEVHCTMIQASDNINTSGLPSQVVAMISYQPRIASVFEEILSDGGAVNFEIRSLQDYIEPGSAPPSSISFLQIQQMVGRTRDVVVGWSTPKDEALTSFENDMRHSSSFVASCKGWEINPGDKLLPREWSIREDMLVVLARALVPQGIAATAPVCAW